ncbi:MAG TPA: hypothetical protein PLD88_02560 [Candidatus Berkiella sp.]|nr:hypothetical protein [Candidatus Berkiella sp.]
MRELSQNELQWIQGGLDTGGYNISFVVSNTVLGAILGVPVALVMGKEIYIAYSAGLFCVYGLSMLTAKSIDALLFEKQPPLA